MSPKYDLTNKKFGKLLVIKRVENNKYGKSQWLCKCDCGNKKIVSSHCLKSGDTKSCGCLKRNSGIKHGLRFTRQYRILQMMKQRCYNPKATKYKNYGGRGIKIGDEWLDENHGIENFYNWSIEHGYADDLTIDRINVNGNYEPSNCRWATFKEQNLNKRNNVRRSDKNVVTKE